MGFSLGSIFKPLKQVGKIIAPGITTLLDRPGDLLKKPGNLLNLGLDLAGAGALGKGGSQFMKSGVGKGLNFLTGAGGGIPQNLEDLFPALAGMAMTGGLDSILGPMGIRTGKGGPYADRGLGDKQLGIAEQMQGFGARGLDQMFGGTNQLMDLQKSLTGIGQDPFSLMPGQEEQLTLGADNLNAGRQSAVSGIRQNMASRGISDPRFSAALEARTHMGANQAIVGQRAGAQQHAFDTRLNTLRDLQQTLFGVGGMGANLMGNAGSIYGQGAQRAIGMDADAKDSVGSLLGYGLSNPDIQNWLKGALKPPKKPIKMKSDYGGSGKPVYA